MVVLIISKEELDNIMARLLVVQNVPLEEVHGNHIVLLQVSKIILKHCKLNGGLKELKVEEDLLNSPDLKVELKD